MRNTDIQNPGAYYAAVDARIKANASKTRRLKLNAALEADSREFRLWLLSPALRDFLSDADTARHNSGELGYDDNDTVWADACAAVKTFRKAYGWPPEWVQPALDDWGGLTDRQLEVCRKIWLERAARAEGRDAAEQARKSAAPAWEAGRQEVTGVVKSARFEEYEVGYGQTSSSVKGLLALEDGRLLWGSLPRRVWGELESPLGIKGETVTFKVTVEPKEGDPTFGFGKRPH